MSKTCETCMLRMTLSVGRELDYLCRVVVVIVQKAVIVNWIDKKCVKQHVYFVFELTYLVHSQRIMKMVH